MSNAWIWVSSILLTFTSSVLLLFLIGSVVILSILSILFVFGIVVILSDVTKFLLLSGFI